MEEPKTPATSPAADCYVAAENHTIVAVEGIMLTIASRSDPRDQSVAVLSKEQATQIVKALCAAHRIEPHNNLISQE